MNVLEVKIEKSFLVLLVDTDCEFSIRNVQIQ